MFTDDKEDSGSQVQITFFDRLFNVSKEIHERFKV